MTNKIKTFFKIIGAIKSYMIYFAEYFHLIKKKLLVIHMRNGIKYLIRPGTTDRFIINEIWIHRIYNPRGFEIKQNDIVLEIGGHIGIFSLFASKLAKNGKVYVFEPSPENFQLLEKNIQINKAENVTAINKAMSNKRGKMTLFVSRGANKGASSLAKEILNSEKVIVETESFSEFMKKIKRIDFLKMDCEGAEYDILMKCSLKLLKKIQKISMEYHNLDEKRNASILAKYLHSNGFNVRFFGGKKGDLYAINKENITY